MTQKTQRQSTVEGINPQGSTAGNAGNGAKRRITMAALRAAMGRKDRSYGWSGAEVYRKQAAGRWYHALIRMDGTVDYSTEWKLTPLQCERLGLNS